MKYAVIYIIALILANTLVYLLGPWFSVINSFVLIGLDLTLRDKIHEQWGNDKVKLGGLIGIASIVSYFVNPASGMIALASFVAFASAMLVDTLVYQKMINKDWNVKTNASNIAGAAVDSIVFPTIAFGAIMIEIMLIQFIAKIVGGFVWSKLLRSHHAT